MKREEVLQSLLKSVEESIEKGAALLQDTEFQQRFEETAAVVVATVQAEVLAALEPAVRRLIRLIEEERNPHAVIRAIELLMELGGLRERMATQINVTNHNTNIGGLTPEDVERLRETVMQLEAFQRLRSVGGAAPGS